MTIQEGYIRDKVINHRERNFKLAEPIHRVLRSPAVDARMP